MSHEDITHIGTIVKLLKKSIVVVIEDANDCSGCSIKSFCRADDNRIELKCENVNDYAIGNKVRIIMTEQSRFNALWWGILLPCVLLIGSIVGCVVCLGFAESISALVGLSLCAVYYVIMYFLRNSIDATLHWSIDKIE